MPPIRNTRPILPEQLKKPEPSELQSPEQKVTRTTKATRTRMPPEPRKPPEQLPEPKAPSQTAIHTTNNSNNPNPLEDLKKLKEPNHSKKLYQDRKQFKVECIHLLYSKIIQHGLPHT
ncbi:hypothetical protein JTB14_007899 [Gonioctena quinquepunctata]|nr:hypothetical protein JTB14_007899 [Gonioctena quinquepunctata]